MSGGFERRGGVIKGVDIRERTEDGEVSVKVSSRGGGIAKWQRLTGQIACATLRDGCPF